MTRGRCYLKMLTICWIHGIFSNDFNSNFILINLRSWKWLVTNRGKLLRYLPFWIYMILKNFNFKYQDYLNSKEKKKNAIWKLNQCCSGFYSVRPRVCIKKFLKSNKNFLWKKKKNFVVIVELDEMSPGKQAKRNLYFELINRYRSKDIRK